MNTIHKIAFRILEFLKSILELDKYQLFENLECEDSKNLNIIKLILNIIY